MEWHALTSDQKKPNSDKIFVLWYGDNFVIPCTPRSVAEVNTNLSNIQENFDELKDLIKETIEMLPKSDIKTSFKDVQKMINNCSELVKSCNTSTGWADLTLPKLPSVESAGSVPVSRIPTRRQPNPEKVKSFTISVPPPEVEVYEEAEESSQAQAQSQSVTFTEESCAMEDNQCPCGKLFVNREDLNSHITSQHKPNNWNCSKCDKRCDSRGVLYKHFRDKHKGLFQYNCQSCDYGNDDRAHFAYHMYKKHGGVEIQGIVKCPNEGCKYVSPQKCILVTHLETCGQTRQNKKYKCEQCEKGYRSKRYLNLHKAADHPEEGADVKQYPCDYLGCEKIYKSPDALRIHKKTEMSLCSIRLRLSYGIFLCMTILHTRSLCISVYTPINKGAYRHAYACTVIGASAYQCIYLYTCRSCVCHIIMPRNISRYFVKV